MNFTNPCTSVCVYIASIPSKHSRVSITPWCNHSFHNAVQPAAGHAGRPCWGILGVSACWYWRRGIDRQVRMIPSRIVAEQVTQLHMLKPHPYIEHAFFKLWVSLFFFFVPCLCVFSSSICDYVSDIFYHAVELLLQSLPSLWHHYESLKSATLPSGALIS